MVVEVIKYKVEFTQVQLLIHGYYKCEPSQITKMSGHTLNCQQGLF